MQQAKALRAVISVILLAGGGLITEAAAQTTLGTVTVHGTWPGGGSGGSGGGGGFGGGGSTTVEEDPRFWFDPVQCAAIETQAAQNQCDLNNVPVLIPNGCGNKDFDVPDFLLARPSLGAIFTPACDSHDICYGNFGTSKDSCDLVLGNKMRNACSEQFAMGVTDLPFAACDEQASLYSGALQSPLIATFISGPTFQQAQKGGQCRFIKQQHRDAGCP
ncbi:MAG: hypothetical protein U0973_03125 [Xanthomonadaceae bacterium]|nr:hypothetical protein [Xanthomonadaceae bacterium]